MQTSSLYVHIPFCDRICSYCDFAKVFYRENLVDHYLDRLEEELKELPATKMKTIYIGGGTPSALQLHQLERLFQMLSSFYDEKTIEYCIEANPESLTHEKIDLMIAYHINRLSLGVQSFNEELLKKIERVHNKDMVEDVIFYANSKGLTNLSIDLMYGLPTQSKEDILYDLEVASHLPLQHISYYSLILEEGTKLNNEHYEGLSEDEDAYYSDLIVNELEKMGYHQYEVSNYAKGDHESEHNKVYWHYENYYGVGSGASGKIDNTLIDHSRALFQYIKGKDTRSYTTLSEEDTMFNHVMMSLRLLEGLDLCDFYERYHKHVEEVYGKAIEKNKDHLVIENNHLHCTKQSLKILNTILLDFLD
ncbi:oxygen-independent coproporphyrinogen-3 oxidase [Kandleria vitulina]|uniref:Heme chaperone HemW n=1 Tax=Kandleria vitulina TaxID=1630 RepID=A0A1H2SYM3_9FIRM|nr:radical SAM family heme chaperone HemW [Kandleria vitulina]SDW36670.1 oxygen-independent coproporphyrinogen-3 oxidase [Kandleria vitulina]